MKKLTKGLFFMIAIMAISFNTSCQKDSTIMYNNTTMGNIVDGRFISDQGNTFNVVEQTCVGRLDTLKRAFILCDVLNRTEGGSDNEYDVRVNQIASVLTKEVVYSTDATEEMNVKDPIHVEYAWISGGYINLYIMFPIKEGSTGKHLINLVHEGFMLDQETGEEINGTYRFSLRHNSYGDKITDDKSLGYVFAGGYVSFPVSSYIMSEEADFSIEWPWHKSLGTEFLLETETRTIKARYTADGFQHAPQTTMTRSIANVE